MNGKDMVAVMMALNKLDGPRFTAKDEEVTPNAVCPSALCILPLLAFVIASCHFSKLPLLVTGCVTGQ